MYLYMKKAQEARSHTVGPSQLISKFEISFDKQSGNAVCGFFPGSTISGTVIYTISAVTQPKGIKLQLIGSEKVNWFEQKEHTGKRFLTVDVHTKSVAAVEGKFMFKVNLPTKLPQSYNGKHGAIQYWIEPVFGEGILTAISGSTRHEGKMNTKQRNEFLKKYRKQVKILPHFDLAAYSSLHQPMSVMRDNSGMFAWKNLIEVILTVPKLGYVPNETIQFKIHIINGSDKTITSSTITLIQVSHITKEAKFCAGPINTQEVKTLFEGSGPQLTTQSCQAWSGTIKIPSKVSPISTRCDFISVDYFLKAGVASTGFMETIEVKVPIVIGTISTTGVDTNEGLGLQGKVPLSSSMESLASQVTFCSHGYIDRSSFDEADKLPSYSTLAAVSSRKVKTDDDWETMSFSSLSTYQEAGATGVGARAAGSSMASS